MRDHLTPIGLSGLFAAIVIGGGMFLDAEANRPRDPVPRDANGEMLSRYPAEIRVLVGTGCDGPSDVAVAREEDMLPRCDRIDAHTVSNETTPEGGE